MFLSIVIPVWNDEKFLNECLDSCLNQELSKDEYEIICVDDGSTDRTPEILRKYKARYPNIRVFTKQHGPISGSGRAIGLNAAIGDFIWFVDHDDFIAPNAVDDLKNAAAEHSDYDRIQFPCYRFFNSFTENELFKLKRRELRLNFYFPPLDWFVWSSIIRRSFLQKNNISPNTTRVREAGVFWGIENFRVWGGDWVFIDACKDYGIKTFCLSGRPLYHYRVHDSSSTKATSPEEVALRAEKRYNMALYRAHRAWIQKQSYLSERSEHGRASVETTNKLVGKLRDAASFLAMQSADQLRKGAKLFLEKDIFLDKKPEEYKGNFRSHWKKLNMLEKLLPHQYAFYYSYTKSGFRMYSALCRLYSLLVETRFMQKIKKRKQEHKTNTI